MAAIFFWGGVSRCVQSNVLQVYFNDMEIGRFKTLTAFIDHPLLFSSFFH